MSSEVVIEADGFVVGAKREHNRTRTASRQWVDVMLVFDNDTPSTTIRVELPTQAWAKWAHRYRFRRDGPDFKLTLRSAWPEDAG